MNPERMHTLIAKIGADSRDDLVFGLRQMANDLERGQLTEGCSGSPSVGTIYSYKVRPEQTHDAYFRQLEEALKPVAQETRHEG